MVTTPSFFFRWGLLGRLTALSAAFLVTRLSVSFSLLTVKVKTLSAIHTESVESMGFLFSINEYFSDNDFV